MRKGKQKLVSSGPTAGIATAAAPRSQQTAITLAPAPGNAHKPPGPAAPTSLYFVNAFVDYAVIGGLSLLVFLVLYVLTPIEQRDHRWATGITMAAMLAWVCNWPHFSATSYRLYHSMDNIMQYPLTALVVPWLIMASLVGAIFSPTLIAPYYVKLFFWWSAYHFCGQTFGITMIYARRAGFPIGRWERLGLNLFIYGTFLMSASRGEVHVEGTGMAKFYEIPFQPLGLPEWLPQVFHVLVGVGGVLFLLFAARWMIAKKRLLPLIILVPAAAQYIWFVMGAGWASYTEFVPFFHCMQYMLIAWSMQLKEKMDLHQIPPSRAYVIGESLRWGFVNIVGGVALFFCFPLVAWAVTERVAPGELLAATRDLFVHQGAPTTPALPFYIGVTIIAVQLHHFFVDGVIWKLKRKSVSSPLMVNVHDMLKA